MAELRLNVGVARDFVERAMQGYGFTAEEGRITAWRHERAWEENLDLDLWPGS